MKPSSFSPFYDTYEPGPVPPGHLDEELHHANASCANNLHEESPLLGASVAPADPGAPVSLRRPVCSVHPHQEALNNEGGIRYIDI